MDTIVQTSEVGYFISAFGRSTQDDLHAKQEMDAFSKSQYKRKLQVKRILHNCNKSKTKLHFVHNIIDGKVFIRRSGVVKCSKRVSSVTAKSRSSSHVSGRNTTTKSKNINSNDRNRNKANPNDCVRLIQQKQNGQTEICVRQRPHSNEEEKLKSSFVRLDRLNLNKLTDGSVNVNKLTDGKINSTDLKIDSQHPVLPSLDNTHNSSDGIEISDLLDGKEHSNLEQNLHSPSLHKAFEVNSSSSRQIIDLISSSTNAQRGIQQKHIASCSYSSRNLQAALDHNTVDQEGLICSICEEAFSDQDNLKNHVQRHLSNALQTGSSNIWESIQTEHLNKLKRNSGTRPDNPVPAKSVNIEQKCVQPSQQLGSKEQCVQQEALRTKVARLRSAFVKLHRLNLNKIINGRVNINDINLDHDSIPALPCPPTKTKQKSVLQQPLKKGEVRLKSVSVKLDRQNLNNIMDGQISCSRVFDTSTGADYKRRLHDEQILDPPKSDISVNETRMEQSTDLYTERWKRKPQDNPFFESRTNDVSTAEMSREDSAEVNKDSYKKQGNTSAKEVIIEMGTDDTVQVHKECYKLKVDGEPLVDTPTKKGCITSTRIASKYNSESSNIEGQGHEFLDKKINTGNFSLCMESSAEVYDKNYNQKNSQKIRLLDTKISHNPFALRNQVSPAQVNTKIYCRMGEGGQLLDAKTNYVTSVRQCFVCGYWLSCNQGEYESSCPSCSVNYCRFCEVKFPSLPELVKHISGLCPRNNHRKGPRAKTISAKNNLYCQRKCGSCRRYIDLNCYDEHRSNCGTKFNKTTFAEDYLFNRRQCESCHRYIALKLYDMHRFNCSTNTKESAIPSVVISVIRRGEKKSCVEFNTRRFRDIHKFRVQSAVSELKSQSKLNKWMCTSDTNRNISSQQDINIADRVTGPSVVLGNPAIKKDVSRRCVESVLQKQPISSHHKTHVLGGVTGSSDMTCTNGLQVSRVKPDSLGSLEDKPDSIVVEVMSPVFSGFDYKLQQDREASHVKPYDTDHTSISSQLLAGQSQNNSKYWVSRNSHEQNNSRYTVASGSPLRETAVALETNIRPTSLDPIGIKSDDNLLEKQLPGLVELCETIECEPKVVLKNSPIPEVAHGDDVGSDSLHSLENGKKRANKEISVSTDPFAQPSKRRATSVIDVEVLSSGDLPYREDTKCSTSSIGGESSDVTPEDKTSDFWGYEEIVDEKPENSLASLFDGCDTPYCLCSSEDPLYREDTKCLTSSIGGESSDVAPEGTASDGWCCMDIADEKPGNSLASWVDNCDTSYCKCTSDDPLYSEETRCSTSSRGGDSSDVTSEDDTKSDAWDCNEIAEEKKGNSSASSVAGSLLLLEILDRHNVRCLLCKTVMSTLLEISTHQCPYDKKAELKLKAEPPFLKKEELS